MDIILPKIGFSMNDAVLTEWLVEDGARIEEGQPLYVIESNKATEEIGSPGTGTLRILKPTGETYDVGTVLGQLV